MRRIGLAGSRPTRTELVARGACASREPLVVDHRARQHDAVRVGVVHADRFGLLRLVPDVDFVGLRLISPLFVRLSQLRTGSADRIPSRCAAFVNDPIRCQRAA